MASGSALRDTERYCTVCATHGIPSMRILHRKKQELWRRRKGSWDDRVDRVWGTKRASERDKISSHCLANGPK